MFGHLTLEFAEDPNHFIDTVHLSDFAEVTVMLSDTLAVRNYSGTLRDTHIFGHLTLEFTESLNDFMDTFHFINFAS